MISPQLSPSIVGKDFVEVLKYLLCFVLLNFTDSFAIDLFKIGESVDYIASEEFAFAYIIVRNVQLP